MKNTFVKVLSFMMALTMIVGAFGAITVSAAECAHEPAGEAIAVVEPTCDTAGFTTYLCKLCGEEYIDAASIKLATGEHDLVDAPAIPATCDENAYTAHKVCTKCDYTEGKTELPGTKLGHKWLIDVEKAATCDEKGYTTKKCARCLKEDKKTFECKCAAATDPAAECTCEKPSETVDGWYEEIDATGHTFKYEVTEAPTNCITGKVTITCEDCDYNNVVANKGAHIWKNMNLSTQPDGTEYKDLVVNALKAIGKEFGDTCGDDFKKGEICIICCATQNTEVSSKTCTNIKHIVKSTAGTKNAEGFYVGADGNIDVANYVVTVGNYVPAMAEVDGKTFAVDSATIQLPTHDANGWVLVFCDDCDKYDIVTLAKGNHSYNASVIWKDAAGNEYPNTATGSEKAYNDKEYHTITMTKYNVCACGAEQATTTKKNATNHNYDWKEGNVQKGKVVTAPTCTANGFITWDCKECEGGDYVELGELALGHEYGEWTYASGYVCGATPADGQMERVCTRKYGNAACALEGYKQTKAAPEGKEHAYAASIKTAATCVANAVYEWKCSDCGNVGTKPEDVTFPVSGFNANNHAVKATDTDRRVQENVVSKTCTTKQKDRYLCECGKTLDLEVGAAPTHLGSATSEWHDTAAGCTATWGLVEGSTDKYELKSGACVATCKVYFLYDATCQAGGVTKAGTFCSTCKVDITKPTTVGKNPEKHTATASENGAQTVPATCIEKGYTLKYYSCCGGVKKVYNPGGTVDAKNHVNVEFVAKVLPTCTTTGTEAYFKCTDCNKLVKAVKKSGATGETKDDYQISTEGTTNVISNPVSINKLSTNGKHDFTVKHNAKAEKCTDKGNVEYYTCKNENCTYIKVGENVFVPTDGDPKDANNLPDGIWDEVEIAPHGNAHQVRYSAYYANVLKPTLKAPTCTEGAWIAPADVTVADDYVCAKCEILTKPATYWAPKLNHDHVLIKEVNKVGSNEYNCTEESYDIYSCSRCHDQYFLNYAEAVEDNHTWLDANNDGVREAATADIIAPGCSTAGKTIYRCQNTNCKYTEEEAGAPAKGHYVKVGSEEKAITFSCKNDAWLEFAGLACEDCGLEVNEDNVEEYGHNIVTKSAAATCTTDGYNIKYCVDCLKTYYSVTVAPADGNYEHEKTVLRETTATANVYYCGDCGQTWEEAIEAVVVEDYAVSADKIFAGDKITVTLTVSGKSETFNSKDITVPYNASKFTLVGVSANAEIEGLYAFAAVKDTNVIGVSLVVANAADGAEREVTTSAEGTVLFTLELQAKKTASGDATVAGKTVKIAGVGNINNDAAGVTAEDAQAIFAHIGKENAAADVNNDGLVNLADVAALATFAASGKSGYDYLVMVGEYAKIEAEVYALLDSGRLANHDAAIAVINVNDAQALIKKIDNVLKDTYANLGDNVTAAEVVAYYNAH